MCEFVTIPVAAAAAAARFSWFIASALIAGVH